jgi:hypothetical protein
LPTSPKRSTQRRKDLNAMLNWSIAGVIAAISVGWLAAWLYLLHTAPVGIVSLGVGVTLGLILAGLAAAMHVNCRKRLLVGAILLGLLTVVAEHAWLYRDFRRQWRESRAKSPEVAMFRPDAPWSPAEYFARELTPARAMLWGVDAVLIVAAVACTIIVSRRATMRDDKTRIACDAPK